MEVFKLRDSTYVYGWKNIDDYGKRKINTWPILGRDYARLGADLRVLEIAAAVVVVLVAHPVFYKNASNLYNVT